MDALARRYGERGLWLIVLGLTWVLFGAGALADPIVAPRPWVLLEHLPPLVQAAGWWITGTVAIGVGLRGPHRYDSVGHLALYLMPAVRVASFGVAWVVYLVDRVLISAGVTNREAGWDRGWYAALIWSLVSMALLLASRWPNPNMPLPPPPAHALTDQEPTT